MSNWTVTFPYLPQNLNELLALPQANLFQPYETAALTVAVLCAYPYDPASAAKMLDYLRGPRPLSNYDKQFISDRFRETDYVPRSYFRGASPQNNYQPYLPYTVDVFDSPYSASEPGFLTLYMRSGGADSPRQVQVRKAKDGKWYLWEQFLLSDIRPSASENPWA